MSVSTQSIREQLEQAIAAKQTEINEFQAALNILTDKNVESVEIKMKKLGRGRPSSKTFMVKTHLRTVGKTVTPVKRGPGRPKGSTNRTPAVLLAD